MLDEPVFVQNAAVGLRLKPSSRRELMILYLYWSEQKKRMMACVAELRNYLVREMQVCVCVCVLVTFSEESCRRMAPLG